MNGNIIVAISGSLNAEVLISITPKAINMKKIVNMITPITVRKLNIILILFLFPVVDNIRHVPIINNIAPTTCPQLTDVISIDSINKIAPKTTPIPEINHNLLFILLTYFFYYSIYIIDSNYIFIKKKNLTVLISSFSKKF